MTILGLAAPLEVVPPISNETPWTSTETPSPPVQQLSCFACGTITQNEALTQAQKQISALESQVRLLNEKAAHADKWADYEDELHNLRRQIAESTAPTAQAATPTQSRFSFLSPRKSVPTLPTPAHSPQSSVSRPPSQHSTIEADLLATRSALQSEKKLRQEAEGKLDEASGELEDLTQQLFEEANKMVREERKARKMLEERIEVLEGRDREKSERLGRLERAVVRIERVRGLLN